MSKSECGATRVPDAAPLIRASAKRLYSERVRIDEPESARRLVLLKRRSDRLEPAHAQLISKIVGTCGRSSRFLRLDKLALCPIREKSGNACFDVSHELICPEIDPRSAFT
jgi:hypothetical protein